MALKYVLLIAISIGCSECYLRHENFNKKPVFADQMCPSEQVAFQKVTRSAVSCVRACAESPGCRSLVYLQGNKTCYGIRSDNPFDTASSSLPGAVFYKSDSAPSTTTSTTSTTTTTTTAIPTTTTDPGCATTVAMVTNVADNQLSASSEYTSSYTGIVYGANRARLDCTGACWTPTNNTTQEYIQVDFVTVRLVEAVITKGDGSYAEWVTSYKILVSHDCAGFTAVNDPTDNDQVFAGNTDRSSNATSVLGPSVTCRCLRINPVTWYDRIAMRFEVNGCDI